jgi:hypothetical protein
LLGKAPNGTAKTICGDHGDTQYANKACDLESRLREVGIRIMNYLINPLHFMMELCGDHANEPIIL